VTSGRQHHAPPCHCSPSGSASPAASRAEWSVVSVSPTASRAERSVVSVSPTASRAERSVVSVSLNHTTTVQHSFIEDNPGESAAEVSETLTLYTTFIVFRFLEAHRVLLVQAFQMSL